jgi:hypothetical protein
MFTYDNRNRLIDEVRSNAHPYHLSYTYDQGGNRKIKIDHLAQLRTEYFYDFEPDTCPDMWGCQSWNNRLMHYAVYDTSGEEWVVTEEMFYEYNTGLTASGHPSLVVRKEYNGEGGRDWYHAVDLQYNSSGELWFVTQRHWPVDDVDCWYQVRDRVTEFRGSGRDDDYLRNCSKYLYGGVSSPW